MKKSKLLLLTFTLFCTANSNKIYSKPNLVLIVADDCSYYDISCFGSVNHKTENIDNLAHKGLKFNNAYNSASMSTPTRHSLYTGMYPMHHGGYANHSRVNSDIKSLPHYLKALGYRVGLAGKWHIAPKKNFPFEHIPGFQQNCVAKEVSYNTDGINNFITRDDNEPFCLVLASVNPHAPWTAGNPDVYDRNKLVLPKQFVDTPKTRDDYARYLAEIDVLDQEVGDIVKILEDNELLDNTLIIFVSEQGAQFAGAKWTNWSAGVKSAMIARWDGIITPDSETEAIVQYEDILPTFIEIAGGKAVENIDGKSLLSLLKGETKKHRDYAFHVHNNVPEGTPYPIRAITKGDYRLIWNINYKKEYYEKHIEKSEWYLSWLKDESSHAKAMINRFKNRDEYELYNIKNDPYEMKNLYETMKDKSIVKEMKSLLAKWMDEQNDKGLAMDTIKKVNSKK